MHSITTQELLQYYNRNLSGNLKEARCQLLSLQRMSGSIVEEIDANGYAYRSSPR